MVTFLYLEGAYLILAAVILLVTLIVASRPFMPKGSIKKGVGWVSLFLAVAIGAHYKVTTDRMAEVKQAFLDNKPIICENRLFRQGAQSIVIRRSSGWRLEKDHFFNEAYKRPFFLARCIVDR